MVALSQGLPVRPRSWAPLVLVGVAWLVAAYLAGLAGVFDPSGTEPPVAIGLAAGLPVVLVGAALLVSRRFRSWAESLDLALLTSLQAWRVGGFVFLVLYATGSLPGGFALPAGLGDLAVALSAPFVAGYLVTHRGSTARRFYLGWTVLGIVDLLAAVTLGVLNAAGPSGILSDGVVTTDQVAQLPLSLIPTFGVPFLLAVHLLSLARLRTYGDA
ncbi:MAG: hypothetical protein ACRDRV_17305 [Pseudonocardiaceae bacterium]